MDDRRSVWTLGSLKNMPRWRFDGKCQTIVWVRRTSGWNLSKIWPNKAVLTTVNRSQSETILQLKPPMVCERFTRGGRPLRSVDNNKNIQRISRTFHHMTRFLWTRSFETSRGAHSLKSVITGGILKIYITVGVFLVVLSRRLQTWWDLCREIYRTRFRSIRPLTVRCKETFFELRPSLMIFWVSPTGGCSLHSVSMINRS